MDEVFAFFFKYRPFFFEQGTLTFQWIPAWWQIALLAAVLAGGLYRLYASLPPGFLSPHRWALPLLRGGFFLLLVLLLMRPALVLSTLVPKQNLLAVLVDNSASMGLEENEVSTRGQQVAKLLEPQSAFLGGLNENFHLRLLKFDSTVTSMEDRHELNWQGEQTNITAALQRVLSETGNLPVGGIILISDGADNSYTDLQPVLDELKARKIPVHTVGVGPERIRRDIEVTQVSVPRRLMPESVAVARVTFHQDDFGGSRGKLEVREGGTLVQSEEVLFPRDAETTTVEVTLNPKSPGIKNYQFRLVPLEGETIAENNTRTALVEVRDLVPRILYVEGRPRWEYKFIRQAVTTDPHIRLETLLRTALNKFYRQGIEEETTLASGFPRERKELFEYKGLVLGSVESAFFSYAQMELIRDFVGQRGGGFLMLGGSASFTGGAYQNTPIEEVLPTWLNDSSESDDRRDIPGYRQEESRLQLTGYGLRHPVLQLAARTPDNEELWRKMPSLQDWNRVRDLKPGATVLAQLEVESGSGASLPLFAFHRYGRGLGLALMTGSSWQWQMLLDHQDSSHETFWRQLLRWLVSSAKDAVTVETERDNYARNEPVQIRAEVNDESFTRVNDARVEAEIQTPSGEVLLQALEWDAREDGVYTGRWAPPEDGLYKIQVRAVSNDLSHDQTYGTAETSFQTATGDREFFDSEQKKDFLQKLSSGTGGRYYSLDQAARLPDEIVYSESESSVVEILDLWDMPANFLLLVGLLFAEWIIRKRAGAI